MDLLERNEFQSRVTEHICCLPFGSLEKLKDLKSFSHPGHSANHQNPKLIVRTIKRSYRAHAKKIRRHTVTVVSGSLGKYCRASSECF